MNPREKAGAEIRALTGVRALAALWVLSLHYNQAFPVIPLDGWLTFVCRGHIGVDIFFVLSGYILTYVYCDRLRFFTVRECRTFLFLRFARIYPAYLAGLLATIGLFVAATMVFSYEFNAPENWRLSHLPFQITMTQAWGFEDIALWNVPSWSVSSEWLAYLTMPLLLPVVLRGRASLRLVLVVVLVTALVVVYGSSGQDVATSFKGGRAVFRVLSEFWLGASLFSLVGRASFPSAMGEAAVVVALGGFVLGPYFAASDVWLLLLCPVLIVGLHQSGGAMARFFSSPPDGLCRQGELFGVHCAFSCPVGTRPALRASWDSWPGTIGQGTRAGDGHGGRPAGRQLFVSWRGTSVPPMAAKADRCGSDGDIVKK